MMDNFWIIHFNEWMKFQVYKCGGFSHDNINDETVDVNAFVLVKSDFQKSWMNAYDWCLVEKDKGYHIHKKIYLFNIEFS